MPHSTIFNEKISPMYCIINSFAQLSTTVTTACYIMVQNKVQKNISSFFGNPKRKVDSEKNAPPSKKQQCTDTLDVPCTNPSTSSTVSESTQAHTTELLVTSSKTFSDKISVSSHGLNDVSPTQVFLEKFPPKKYGEKYRSFSSAWYSVVFCGNRWCILFPVLSVRCECAYSKILYRGV